MCVPGQIDTLLLMKPGNQLCFTASVPRLPWDSWLYNAVHDLSSWIITRQTKAPALHLVRCWAALLAVWLGRCSDCSLPEFLVKGAGACSARAALSSDTLPAKCPRSSPCELPLARCPLSFLLPCFVLLSCLLFLARRSSLPAVLRAVAVGRWGEREAQSWSSS